MASLILAVQAPLAAQWRKLVSDTVPDPYLDEVFHIRQAQHYCQNRFDIWDGKITTPPGLYLLSYVLSPVLGCDVFYLRALSVLCLMVIPYVLASIYAKRQSYGERTTTTQHSALNISVFPPLFFFSALYYTDVPSTLSVLLFYRSLLSTKRGGLTFLRYSGSVALGVMSLLFRQTNIFWVAVFPAGLTLVNELDNGHRVVKDSIYRRVAGFGDSARSVARTSWKMDVVYDPTVRDAWVEDYINTTLSLATSLTKTLLHPTRLPAIALQLSPYLTILTLFTIFTLYNGGVVLGDKSNHAATLHLAQLLYLWPFFTFFPWPLLYPYLLTLPLSLYAKLAYIAPLQTMLIFTRRRLVPRFRILMLFTVLACLVVRFNTIVHPFILADNRHYTFYIFRLLLRRNKWTRYAVTPLYVLSGWACIQAFGARALATSQTAQIAGDEPPAEDENAKTRMANPTIPDGANESAKTTFVLVWFATTALQLVTAPLVEPRYFILPWVFWRLHVPLQAQYRVKEGEGGKGQWDSRLGLESVWFILVNVVTGWIFLRWDFEWPQAVGEVQRFMW